MTRDDAGAAFVRSLVGFGRVLRRAGLTIAPEQIGEAARAIALVGADDRDAVRRAARALLVTRREDLPAFELLFEHFWRHPDDRLPVRRPRLPVSRRPQPAPAAFTLATWSRYRDTIDRPSVDVTDRAGTWSDAEILQSKAFGELSAAELDAVRRLMLALRYEMPERVTRRRVADKAGDRIDLRRVLRETTRLGGVPARLPRRSRVVKSRPLVLIADISGSMERYARLVLQFFHTVMRTLPDAEAFAFGTRLTRLTPHLRVRNIDRAIDDASRHVVDWAGGTRIGACLGEFSRRWGRRVLRRGAVVVILSDGLDRGDPARLAREMRHLAHRSYRVVWLNPHLGQAAYAPRAAGMAAALPYVDDFLSVRDLRSLVTFAYTLSRLTRRRGARGGGWKAAS